MREKIRVWGAGVALMVCVSSGGCSSDSPLGGIGGQMLGNAAGNMLSGGAQKQAKQQQAAAQQQQQQQAAVQQQASQQQAPAYRAPAMEMTGTLKESKAADGTAAGWTFTQQQSAVSTPVDVSAVEKDVRKLAGKQVTITGRYDTLGTGAFVVEKAVAAAE
jgi:hypothetical protein